MSHEAIELTSPIWVTPVSSGGIAPGREKLAQIAGEGRPPQVLKDYSPTTMYDDYPISPTLFHWQSQSFTRPPQPILPTCDEIHNS